MTHRFTDLRSGSRLRALGWLTLLAAGLSCGSDKDAPNESIGPSDPPPPGWQDSLPAPDSLIPGDSLPPVDSLPGPDSLPEPDLPPGPDSLPEPDSLSSPPPPPGPEPPPQAPPSHSGTPFGLFRLWRDSSPQVSWGPEPFTASFNSIHPYDVVLRINSARAMNHRLFLALSTGHSRYMTAGKFDMAKWKNRIDTFDQPEIRAAIAAGVADGTIIGNSVLDEPNTSRWGGVIGKALVDEMCVYVKSIFPTLPNGVVTVHWWRPSERFKACDFVINQWAWWYGPHGPGPGSYTGNLPAWREEALKQAKKDGVAIVFSMNLLNGGIQSWETRACPPGTTGGKGTHGIACRMTANQVREWGLALGPAGCAMLMWRHDADFVSKAANLQAIREVAARLAGGPVSSCRRPS